jgi:GAF domain-containing protein
MDMRRTFLRRDFRYRIYFWVALVGVAVILSGCQAKEPPLSPAAAAFKKEVRQCIQEFSNAVMEPLAKNDVAAISAALEKVEPKALKLCRMCPFRIAVLNQHGEALAVHPAAEKSKRSNFSNYDLVIKTINSKKIQQQRFFLQNGSQLYIICVPLIRQDKVIGLLAIAIDAAEAEQRWGLTGKEFLALDLNT